VKKIKELLDKQSQLIEEIEVLKNQKDKKQQDLEEISTRISEMKEQQDFGAFKFVYANIPLIIQKIAPKHRVPPPREISLSSGADAATVVAAVPWGEADCSDINPVNINVCPRCTLLHFQKILDKLLAGYYAK